MAQGATLQLRGYREFLRATDRADRESKRYVRDSFRRVGEIVRAEAANRFSPIDQRTAAGYRTRIRQRGIAVEQSLAKTTGARPDFGSLQMRRALLPALMANQDTLMRDLDLALDRVADHFERGP
jgi:hypothetical protein